MEVPFIRQQDWSHNNTPREFQYGDRVIVKSGFYKGIKGTLIHQVSTQVKAPAMYVMELENGKGQIQISGEYIEIVMRRAK